MYQVLFYLKDQPCDIIKGFPTREAAWRWVDGRLNDIEYYKIEPYEETV